MGEYIRVIVSVGICASLLLLLVPSEQMKGHQRLISGLCIICVMISPVASAIELAGSIELGDIFSEGSQGGEDRYEEYMEELTVSTASEIVRESLEESFGVRAQDIKISCAGQGDRLKIENIYILLPRSAVFKDTAKIRLYFRELFGCEVVVAIS